MINPLEAVVWVAVGGRGTLLGPHSRRVWGEMPSKELGHARAYPDLSADFAVSRSGVSCWSLCSCRKGSWGWPEQLRGIKKRLLMRAAKRRTNPPRPYQHSRRAELAKNQMSTAPRQFVLMLEDVSKTFDGFKAISESQRRVHGSGGSCGTIIGPNGAGKSTIRRGISSPAAPSRIRAKIEFGANTALDLTRLE